MFWTNPSSRTFTRRASKYTIHRLQRPRTPLRQLLVNLVSPSRSTPETPSPHTAPPRAPGSHASSSPAHAKSPSRRTPEDDRSTAARSAPRGPAAPPAPSNPPPSTRASGCARSGGSRTPPRARSRGAPPCVQRPLRQPLQLRQPLRSERFPDLPPRSSSRTSPLIRPFRRAIFLLLSLSRLRPPKHGISDRLSRTGQCDMYPPSRLRQCYMFLPETRLMRHVPAQPAPPVLHVPPRGPANATCIRPADSASATCSCPRPGECDMYPARRLRLCYMFLLEDRPMRHVSGPPVRETRALTQLGDSNSCALLVANSVATCAAPSAARAG